MKDYDKMIAIYTEKDEGLFEELTFDLYNREYEFVHGCKKEDLGKEHDKKVKEFRVDRDFFYALYDIIEYTSYSGADYDARDYIDEKQQAIEESKKPLITKEKVWQALRWELDEKELDRIISFDYRYEKDDYYDFNLIMEKIHALMNGEKSIRYFTSWCIVLMRCFMDNMTFESERLSELFYDLGDFFDAVAFMDADLKGEEKLKDCRDTIARFKHFNHEICDLRNNTKTDFMTNGVITFVTFDACIGRKSTAVFKFCIVDTKKKRINFLYSPEVDYSEEINYTFLSEADFEWLPHQNYGGYSFDPSMGVDHALKKRR